MYKEDLRRKICFITSTRAEYGLLKWLMREVEQSERFILQLIVTGAHLIYEQGRTINAIKEDGFTIDEIVDVKLDASSQESIAESMGLLAQLISRSFAKLSPDFIVVLGDRYELLPIVNTAFVMRIPVLHLSGGDVTEGAIDDGIRNAITMLSDYHFTGTEASKNNIIRMRGDARNIWVIGEPGIDLFYREKLMDQSELAKELSLDEGMKWVLFTFHPETKETIDYNLSAVENCINSLMTIENIQVVATYANVDYGGKEINEYLENRKLNENGKLKVIPSLGNRRYLSMMKQACCVVGNSSSGIIEAPALGVPVVNVGNRQKGRHLCNNVIQTDIKYELVREAVKRAMSTRITEPDTFWGDGHASERFIRIIEKEL